MQGHEDDEDDVELVSVEEELEVEPPQSGEGCHPHKKTGYEADHPGKVSHALVLPFHQLY